MRLHLAPEPLLCLITTLLLTPQPIAAHPNPPPSAVSGFTYDELFARWDCMGTKCGYYGQLCCTAGSACATNAATQAICVPPSSAAGGWGSTAAPSFSAAASSSMRCNYAINDSPCGGVCCHSSEYCARLGTCSPAYGKQTTTTKGGAQPGIIVTSSSGIIITMTAEPTSTVAFVPPVAPGANVTMTISGGSSLSGGAIAGIVIGVLVGLAILAILCFYCCLKGIWDGVLAIFGLGRKRKVTRVDEYSRHSHHASGRKNDRTWYGAPAVVKRKEEKKKDSHLGELVGLGAGLAGLWAILGLKRRREDRRHNNEKYSEYSYSSDYYTSASSESSDDRRTERYSRHSTRRAESRRR